MRKVSEYTKLQVLAAAGSAPGRTVRERVRAAAAMSFEDEGGNVHRFTWRTIETWRLRYRKHGRTAVIASPRSDRGKARKVGPEEVLEAIGQARACLRPGFRLSELYRACIEKGLLRREQIAPNTFRRTVKRFDLLKDDRETTSKRRLAFAKAHANDGARQRGDGAAPARG